MLREIEGVSGRIERIVARPGEDALPLVKLSRRDMDDAGPRPTVSGADGRPAPTSASAFSPQKTFSALAGARPQSGSATDGRPRRGSRAASLPAFILQPTPCRAHRRIGSGSWPTRLRALGRCARG